MSDVSRRKFLDLSWKGFALGLLGLAGQSTASPQVEPKCPAGPRGLQGPPGSSLETVEDLVFPSHLEVRRRVMLRLPSDADYLVEKAMPLPLKAGECMPPRLTAEAMFLDCQQHVRRVRDKDQPQPQPQPLFYGGRCMLYLKLCSLVGPRGFMERFCDTYGDITHQEDLELVFDTKSLLNPLYGDSVRYVLHRPVLTYTGKISVSALNTYDRFGTAMPVAPDRQMAICAEVQMQCNSAPSQIVLAEKLPVWQQFYSSQLGEPYLEYRPKTADRIASR